jgi:hypothetical protein
MRLKSYYLMLILGLAMLVATASGAGEPAVQPGRQGS